MTAWPDAPGGEQTGAGLYGTWCSWHQGAARSRPVQVIERGLGAGGTLYACLPCRIKHKLEAIPTTAAWAALLDHLGGTADTPPCVSCNQFKRCREGSILWADWRRQRKADRS